MALLPPRLAHTGLKSRGRKLLSTGNRTALPHFKHCEVQAGLLVSVTASSTSSLLSLDDLQVARVKRSGAGVKR
eukprot:758771-Hanusia_phi.AAC.4